MWVVEGASGQVERVGPLDLPRYGQQYLDVPVVPGQLQVCKPPLQQTLSVHA